MKDHDSTPFEPVAIPASTIGRHTTFKEIYKLWVLEAGAKGASIKGMWAYCFARDPSVRLATFEAWVTRSNRGYRPDFDAYVREGLALAQMLFEEIGKAAAAGAIDKHSSGTYTFMMKNRFKTDYTDTVHKKIDQAGTLKIEPGMPAQLAAQRYKDMILGSGTPREPAALEEPIPPSEDPFDF